MKKIILRAALIALTVTGITTARADEVKVAVAANFTAAIKKITPLFEAKTGHTLVASFGATGQLHAQISNGAPFDVLLAADDVHPPKIIEEGLGVPGSNFVYAIGKLALWSSDPKTVDNEGKVLSTGSFDKLAIANPKTAPYGQAAVETLQALGLYDKLSGKFVTGENIAQAQQFVASGNAQLGFVALAQVLALPAEQRGSSWIVPEKLHQPIVQQAVLLKVGENNKAAQEFLVFLKSPAAIDVIRALGYEPGNPSGK